jgi:hypothetical protein
MFETPSQILALKLGLLQHVRIPYFVRNFERAVGAYRSLGLISIAPASFQGQAVANLQYGSEVAVMLYDILTAVESAPRQVRVSHSKIDLFSSIINEL